MGVEKVEGAVAATGVAGMVVARVAYAGAEGGGIGGA